MNLVKYVNTLVVAVVAVALPLGAAQAQTSAQLQKFKQLNRSEQEAIAKAAGVALPLGGSYEARRSELPSTLERREGAHKLDAESKGGSGSEAKAPALIDAESGLPYFGYDVFAGHPTSFTPIGDLPVPADYVVGPGDVITVQMFGKENKSLRLEVGRSGYISFPRLGPISVSGQSFRQVKESLVDQIRRQMIGVEASIGIDDIRLMQVYVLGEAFQPGAYNIPSLATVTQSIIAAGGIKPTGSLRRIKVFRNKEAVVELDLYEFLTAGNSGKDIRLQSGDVVFIEPVNGRVVVSGNVVRPAVYEAVPGETLSAILAYAGGATENANARSIRIERKSNVGITVSTVDASRGEGKFYQIAAGDKISVPAQNDGLMSGIKLVGAFVESGYREFVPGMRISDLIIDAEADLHKFADQKLAILFRESSSTVFVRYIPLSDVLERPESEANIVLERQDELIVLPGAYRNSSARNADKGSGKDKITTKLEAVDLEIIGSVAKQRRDIVDELVNRVKASASAYDVLQIVEVRGAVKYPGVYPLGEGQTLEHLVTIAGGLKDSAYTELVELARVTVQGSGDIVVNNKKIDIKNKILSSLPLVARDRVTVFDNPDWRNDITVSLEGEVRFPGSYSFARGETLAQLIERAGGFTDFAYPQGAVLSREELRKREGRELKRLRASLREEVASLSLKGSSSLGGGGLSVSPAEAMSAVDALGEVEALGRLVVDLPAAIGGSDIHDIPLEDGDRLVVPSSSNTVTVIGEVQYASSHVFEAGLSYKHYLSRAGGMKERADKDRVYIIRANGRVVLPRNSWFGVEVQEGDTVVVPIDAQHADKLTLFSTVTQILYQLGVAYDVIKD